MITREEWEDRVLTEREEQMKIRRDKERQGAGLESEFQSGKSRQRKAKSLRMTQRAFQLIVDELDGLYEEEQEFQREQRRLDLEE